MAHAFEVAIDDAQHGSPALLLRTRSVGGTTIVESSRFTQMLLSFHPGASVSLD
jgi:hypothetical protein